MIVLGGTVEQCGGEWIRGCRKDSAPLTPVVRLPVQAVYLSTLDLARVARVRCAGSLHSRSVPPSITICAARPRAGARAPAATVAAGCGPARVKRR